MNFEGKKIVLISPHFFGYEDAMVTRLRELGAEVDFYNERPSNTIFTKGIIRVNKNVFQRRINAYYQNILEQTTGKRFDFFLLIKGESIPIAFLAKFKEQHPETTLVYYAYDAAQEYPKLLELYPLFDRNFTFEPTDAQKYGLHFRPLFFINDYQNTQKTERQFDLVFIGSAHTDRYIIGEKIRKASELLKLKTFFYYYTPGKIVFILRRIFDKNLQRFDFRKLSFKKLSHHDIAIIYAGSGAVLDLNKPFQKGLTMRTFETLASGKKLVTTNADIQYYPFYYPENVQIIDRENPQLNRLFFKTEIRKITPEVLTMMSLDSWFNAIFFEDQDDYWKNTHPIFSKSQ